MSVKSLKCFKSLKYPIKCQDQIHYLSKYNKWPNNNLISGINFTTKYQNKEQYSTAQILAIFLFFYLNVARNIVTGF